MLTRGIILVQFVLAVSEIVDTRLQKAHARVHQCRGQGSDRHTLTHHRGSLPCFHVDVRSRLGSGLGKLRFRAGGDVPVPSQNGGEPQPPRLHVKVSSYIDAGNHFVCLARGTPSINSPSLHAVVVALCN